MSDPQPPVTASVVAVVAAALQAHGWNEFREACACGDGDDGKWDYRQDADYAPHVAAAVVEAQREAATITTVAQSDALPLGAVIRCGDDILIRSDQFHGGLCWRHNPDGDPMFLIGDDLPALLLWNPEWVAVDGSNP